MRYHPRRRRVAGSGFVSKPVSFRASAEDFRPTTPPAEEFRPNVRVARHSSAIIITEVPHSVDTDEPDLRPPVRASPESARITRAVTACYSRQSAVDLVN